jgi:succinate dehydrogenase / fumarate reductase flavoprotein subunit
MYERITGESPWSTPMRIYPAPHYTMGGLWVDYDLMTTLPGLFAIGEANFSDHGANRLGASSMMQCLADGYFIIPLTIGDYLSRHPYGDVDTDHAAFADAEREVRERVERLLGIGGSSTVESLHRELGRLMWDHCGIARNADGLREALKLLPALRERFWNDLRIVGSGQQLNQTLEHAGRLADFLEFGELMCRDALERDESCGCHFREEHQTEDGEALRDDVNFSHVTVWEHAGMEQEPRMHQEPLSFEALPLAQRNYKT